MKTLDSILNFFVLSISFRFTREYPQLLCPTREYPQLLCPTREYPQLLCLTRERGYLSQRHD
jgi:hypothetical protein